MVTLLKSQRAVLRPVAESDASELHRVWTSAGVRRFLWDDRVIPAEQTAEAIAYSARLFSEHGFGLWVARATGTGRLIGFTGVWPFRDPPEFELLYGVAEELWGRGFASEIATAVVGYCFGPLDMPAIRASTDVGNVASVRVLEKIGFRMVGREARQGLDTVFFERRRHE